MRTRAALLVLAAALSACVQSEGTSARDGARSAADAAPVSGSTISPSVTSARRQRTPDEILAVFRAGLVPASGLSGGATSRELLVRRFARAIERRDTSAIRAMVLNRPEFAYIYYPSSPYTRPPTVQEAPLAWFLLVQNSQKGVTRVVNRFGGRPAEYIDHRCDETPTREGANLFWRDCVMTIRTQGEGIVTRRLFGSIIERDGQYKFFSYSNEF